MCNGISVSIQHEMGAKEIRTRILFGKLEDTTHLRGKVKLGWT